MERLAPAKLNLNLHVTGKQPNGYHTLQSLVAFTSIGDHLTCADHIPHTPYPFAHVYKEPDLHLHVRSEVTLDDAFFPDNLIYKAARALAEYSETYNTGIVKPVHLTLEKHLPIGAGLGGGSSDAAATLHLLNTYWQMHLPLHQLQHMASTLGSDIAACLTPKAQWMTGSGNELTSANIDARMWVVLAFPGLHLPAKEVYGTYRHTNIHAHEAMHFGEFSTTNSSALLDYLAQTENHLTEPAIQCAPVISDVLTAMTTLPNVKLSRMSGSGSACFGLFESEAHAIHGAERLKQQQPDWWVTHCSLCL